MSNIEQDARVAKEISTSNKNQLILMLLMSFGLIVTPMAFKSSSNANRGAMMGVGILVSAIGLFKSKSSERLQKISDKFNDQELKNLAYNMAASEKLSSVLATVEIQEKQASLVENMMPYKQARYVEQFKLQGLVAPGNSSAQFDVSSGESNVVSVRKQLPTFNGNAARLISMEWMDQRFWVESKVILGESRSGKTSMFEVIIAQLLSQYQDIDIKFMSIHYPPKKERMFPNLPIEIEESMCIGNPKQIYQELQNWYAELIRREQQKDYSRPLSIRILDEFTGLKDYLSDDEWKQVVNIFIQVKNRGAKFGADVETSSGTLSLGMYGFIGSHSLKTKMTGLDSNFLAGSIMVCLGNTISDANTVFPSDFDSKDLMAAMASAKAEIRNAGLEKECRPAVVKYGEDAPIVRLIPKPNLSNIQWIVNEPTQDTLETPKVTLDNSKSGDWLEQIVLYARQQKTLPSDEDLLEFFYKISGKHLTPELLSDIRDIIKEELG